MTLKTKVIGLSSRFFSTLHNKKKRIAKSRIRERLPSLNEDIGMDNRTLQRALETRRQIVRQTVSPEEWEAREDLAACYRLCVHYRMTDMIYNHISLRVPGSDDHFLINAFGLLYEEVSASNLIKVDIVGSQPFKARFHCLHHILALVAGRVRVCARSGEGVFRGHHHALAVVLRKLTEERLARWLPRL